MSGRTGLGPIDESAYADLLRTLSDSAMGRAFLGEYLRRASPENTFSLLHALQRIEAAIASIRDQLRPEGIAAELRHIRMALEIATDGMDADPDGDELSRRMAIILRARHELAALAASLDRRAADQDAEPR